MSKTRRGIPARVQKQLLVESGGKCARCGNSEPQQLEFHHIHGDPGDSDPSHLIVLCANCHADADRGFITRAKLYELKVKPSGPRERDRSESPALAIVQHGDHSIAAGRDVTIVNKNTSKRAPPEPPRPGSVATSLDHRNYLEYLVKRYNEFIRWDRGPHADRGSYIVIRKAFEREFGCPIRHLPLSRFEEAAAFLQGRILRTKVGRIQNSRGQRVFSKWDVWQVDRGGGDEPAIGRD